MECIAFIVRPSNYDYEEAPSCVNEDCANCFCDMTKTDGYRNGETLWYCPDCGSTYWKLDEDIQQQRERERRLLEAKYGVDNPSSIRDYWQRPAIIKPQVANRGR